MVTTSLPVDDAAAAERALALSYARAGDRPVLAALLALDSALGQVVRTTREPLLGQMRLAWWRDALGRLDTAPAPAEPVLRSLQDNVLARGVTGAGLSAFVDGWEALLADPLDAVALDLHARERGGRLFALAGADECATRAGEGWALADLATHLSDRSIAARAATMARERFAVAFTKPWPPHLRALGALALLARADLEPNARPGAPGRVARLLWHRLTGR